MSKWQQLWNGTILALQMFSIIFFLHFDISSFLTLLERLNETALLQSVWWHECRLNVNMKTFTTNSTSKIWHTSTWNWLFNKYDNPQCYPLEMIRLWMWSLWQVVGEESLKKKRYWFHLKRYYILIKYYKDNFLSIE